MELSDNKSTGSLAHDINFGTYRCAGTCTANYGVSMDADGKVTNSATATLHLICGVAMETGAAGDVIRVQTGGFNNTLVTDGDVEAADLVLRVVNGGTFTGSTESEMAADVTLGYHVIGINIGVDVSTAGICYIGKGPHGFGNDT